MGGRTFEPSYLDRVCVRGDFLPHAAERYRQSHILAALASIRSHVLFTLLLAFLGRAGKQPELARDQTGRAIPLHYGCNIASEL